MKTGDTAIIRSINISGRKGVVKVPVPGVQLDRMGIQGDAHAGTGHRQVSLLALESIRAYEQRTDTRLDFGAFGENITTEGMPLHTARVLDRLHAGDVSLEITQIGKKCHGNRCAIYKDTGNCIMPDEGIFARVVSGGHLGEGDRLEYISRVFTARIITLSDRAFAGVYPDKSGKRIGEILENWFGEKGLDFRSDKEVIPDDREVFGRLLKETLRKGYDLVITTGSTGLGRRDIAPEVAEKQMDKKVPGLMDHIRLKYGRGNPNALLSRSMAGTHGRSLLFVLPGSVHAVSEYLEEICRGLWHMILMVNDIDGH